MSPAAPCDVCFFFCSRETTYPLPAYGDQCRHAANRLIASTLMSTTQMPACLQVEASSCLLFKVHSGSLFAERVSPRNAVSFMSPLVKDILMSSKKPTTSRFFDPERGQKRPLHRGACYMSSPGIANLLSKLGRAAFGWASPQSELLRRRKRKKTNIKHSRKHIGAMVRARVSPKRWAVAVACVHKGRSKASRAQPLKAGRKDESTKLASRLPLVCRGVQTTTCHGQLQMGPRLAGGLSGVTEARCHGQPASDARVDRPGFNGG